MARRITSGSDRLRAAVTSVAYATAAPVPPRPFCFAGGPPGRPRGSSARSPFASLRENAALSGSCLPSAPLRENQALETDTPFGGPLSAALAVNKCHNRVLIRCKEL